MILYVSKYLGSIVLYTQIRGAGYVLALVQIIIKVVLEKTILMFQITRHMNLFPMPLPPRAQYPPVYWHT